MLDSDDAMHIVKMDLANLIMQAPPEKRDVSLKPIYPIYLLWCCTGYLLLQFYTCIRIICTV